MTPSEKAEYIAVMDELSDIIWKHVESHWDIMWYDCPYCESINSIADTLREYTGLEDI